MVLANVLRVDVQNVLRYILHRRHYFLFKYNNNNNLPQHIINKINSNRTRGVHIYDIYLLYIFDMKGKNNNNTKVIK